MFGENLDAVVRMCWDLRGFFIVKDAKDFVLIFGEPCAGVHGFWGEREARNGQLRHPIRTGFCLCLGEPGARAPGPLALTENNRSNDKAQ
jgi:hypothetical protein